jgi:hypothetical protein
MDALWMAEFRRKLTLGRFTAKKIRLFLPVTRKLKVSPQRVPGLAYSGGGSIVATCLRADSLKRAVLRSGPGTRP